MIESGSNVLETTQTEVRKGTRAGHYFELTKPRLTLLSVLTTLAGFYVAADGNISGALLTHTLLGTFLVGGGCGALNMVLEREFDGQMRRTMSRPIPSGKLTVVEALIFGIILSVAGIVYLSLAVNLLTGMVGTATLVSYLFFYTPLKRRTTLNTIVGAIPGALPPVMGWTAVHNNLGLEALALFSLLFFWQMPHFLALAWMYRKDYERAGYKMLPVVDEEGISTSRQILVYVAALLPVSLIPTLVSMSGLVYFFGALALGLAFVFFSFRLAFSRSNADAKALFHYSLLYLPILLLVMALDGSGL